MIYTENMLSLFPNRFRIYHSGMWIKKGIGCKSRTVLLL